MIALRMNQILETVFKFMLANYLIRNMTSKTFFLNIDSLLEQRRLISNLLHSITADGIKKFSKE